MIDIIGHLYEPPLSEDGVPVLLPGWHANATPEVLAARPDLEPYVVAPSFMRRVWAGDDPANPVLTVALRFASAEEGLAILADWIPAAPN